MNGVLKGDGNREIGADGLEIDRDGVLSIRVVAAVDAEVGVRVRRDLSRVMRTGVDESTRLLSRGGR